MYVCIASLMKFRNQIIKCVTFYDSKHQRKSDNWKISRKLTRSKLKINIYQKII